MIAGTLDIEPLGATEGRVEAVLAVAMKMDGTVADLPQVQESSVVDRDLTAGGEGDLCRASISPLSAQRRGGWPWRPARWP